MKYVYLYKSYENGYYKIGVSKYPELRIRQLQTGNPEKIELINKYKSNFPYKLETMFHNKYKINKINGEWFNLGLEEELSFIQLCESTEKNYEILKEMGNPFF